MNNPVRSIDYAGLPRFLVYFGARCANAISAEGVRIDIARVRFNLTAGDDPDVLGDQLAQTRTMVVPHLAPRPRSETTLGLLTQSTTRTSPWRMEYAIRAKPFPRRGTETRISRFVTIGSDLLHGTAEHFLDFTRRDPVKSYVVLSRFIPLESEVFVRIAPLVYTRQEEPFPYRPLIARTLSRVLFNRSALSLAVRHSHANRLSEAARGTKTASDPVIAGF